MNKNDRYHFLSMLGHDPPTNQCLDMVNTSRSGRGNEGAGEERGTEDDGQAAGSGCGIEGAHEEGQFSEEGYRHGIPGCCGMKKRD